jgi:hypothetical protein
MPGSHATSALSSVRFQLPHGATVARSAAMQRTLERTNLLIGFATALSVMVPLVFTTRKIKPGKASMAH